MMTKKLRLVFVTLVFIILIVGNTFAGSLSNNWDMYGYDLENTGNYPGEIDLLGFGEYWTFKTSSEVVTSPAINEGVAYFGNKDGYFYAVDLVNRKELWSYYIGSEIYSSPTIYDGKVYFGTDNYNLYALNIYDGSLAWIYHTFFLIRGSPSVAEGKVVVGSLDGRIYVVDAETGLYNWHVQTGDWIFSTPAINSVLVYITSWDNHIYAFDLDTGREIWKYAIGNVIYSSPVVKDDIVYFGGYDNKVYALDAYYGSVVWSYDVDYPISVSPSTDGDYVYISNANGILYALKNGEEVWSVQLNGRFVRYTKVIIVGDKLFVGSSDNYIYALDKTDGSVLWSYMLNGGIRESPSIYEDYIVVGSEDGSLNVFRPAQVCDASYECKSNVELDGEARWCRDFGEGYNWYTLEEGMSYCDENLDRGNTAYCGDVEIICVDDLKWKTCSSTLPCNTQFKVNDVQYWCRNFNDEGWKWTKRASCNYLGCEGLECVNYLTGAYAFCNNERLECGINGWFK